MLALAGVGLLLAAFLVACVSLRAIRETPHFSSTADWVRSELALALIAILWVMGVTELLAGVLAAQGDAVTLLGASAALVAALLAFRWLLRRQPRPAMAEHPMTVKGA